MAEVCLDVVDVKTHRSMGGNVYSCVQGEGGVGESAEEKELRGVERERKSKREKNGKRY